MRLHWLLATALFALTTAYLHTQAMEHFLYWHYDWFDILVHFLGGLTIASFLIGIFVTRKAALLIVAFIAVAIGWEVFEYLLGFPREAEYLLDTVIDLVMDTLGAVLAYLVARKTIWR